jgi:hypothetical protein
VLQEEEEGEEEDSQQPEDGGWPNYTKNGNGLQLLPQNGNGSQVYSSHRQLLDMKKTDQNYIVLPKIIKFKKITCVKKCVSVG